MKHYFTFGQNHTHPVTGESMKDYWIEIEAPDMATAVKEMMKRYAYNWSMHYIENEFTEIPYPSNMYESITVDGVSVSETVMNKKNLDELFEKEIKRRNDKARVIGKTKEYGDIQ